MKKILSATDLKILAIIAMTVDHTAFLLVDQHSLLYYFMRMFGRLTAPSLILLGVLISLAHFGDWSYLIPAWTIIFFCYYKRDTKKMIVLFALASVTLQTLLYLKEFDSFALFSFQYGTLLALVPISMYNGERGYVRHKNLNRWFFYVYYPAHMIVLMIIQELLG